MALNKDAVELWRQWMDIGEAIGVGLSSVEPQIGRGDQVRAEVVFEDGAVLTIKADQLTKWQKALLAFAKRPVVADSSKAA